MAVRSRSLQLPAILGECLGRDRQRLEKERLDQNGARDQIRAPEQQVERNHCGGPRA